MSNFRADLHCHSTVSDGSQTPEQLFDFAKKRGLQGLSITDHDTVGAYITAFSIAKEKEIRLITGVEFSASERQRSVHILGYAFNPDHPDIENLCREHEKRRRYRNLAILEELKKLNYPISEEELLHTHPTGTMGRPHIALTMIKKGYVKSVQEAFLRFLGDGKSAYVQGDYPSVEKTLNTIHSANGFAIIAHPHLIKKGSIVRTLLEMPFDGMECYYAKIPPHQERRWIQIAKEKQWIITGGSDFHGSVKPHNSLGSSWTKEEIFLQLEQRMYANIT